MGKSPITGAGRFVSVLLLASLSFPSCDKGLAPPTAPVPHGRITGLITYRHWPPRDSLIDLRLVAFKQFPPTNVVSSVLNGEAFVYPPLGDTALVPFYVDSLRFDVPLRAGYYPYVVVAQQYDTVVTRDWRVVGQYDLDTNLAVPSGVDVPDGAVVPDINILVDFSDPPPQPF